MFPISGFGWVAGLFLVCRRFAILPSFYAKFRGLLQELPHKYRFYAIIPEFYSVFRGLLQADLVKICVLSMKSRSCGQNAYVVIGR